MSSHQEVLRRLVEAVSARHKALHNYDGAYRAFANSAYGGPKPSDAPIEVRFRECGDALAAAHVAEKDALIAYRAAEPEIMRALEEHERMSRIILCSHADAAAEGKDEVKS